VSVVFQLSIYKNNENYRHQKNICGNIKMVKMIIEKGTAKNKKYKAIFYDDKGKKIKTSQFGDVRYQDYTMHKDKERRAKYRKRHKNTLSSTNYMSPSHLAYFLLWGESVALKTNINNYKKKFKLK